MKERVCVHGAAGSIGSSCVEIISGRNHLILDYGKALEGETSVPFVFPEDSGKRKNYKVFISHSHADHTGYVAEIPEDVEVFMHDMTYRALILQDTSYGKRSYNTVHGYEIIRWNGINIMFIPVNHSAPDACEILIATKENTYLYTGDYSMHGYGSDAFTSTVSKYLDTADFKRDNFTVITEGTNLGAEDKEEINESDTEDMFAKEFKKPGLVVVKMANQNIGRLYSIYKACLRTGRTLVTEPYTAVCAKELTAYTESCPWEVINKFSRPYNLYPNGRNWKVFCINTNKTKQLAEEGKLQEFGKVKISNKEIYNNNGNLVIVANSQFWDYLKRNKKIKRVIWSMWTGYPEYEKVCKKFDTKVIHSSGHAYENEIKTFISHLKPDKTIIVHSECSEEAIKLLNGITQTIIPALNKEF